MLFHGRGRCYCYDCLNAAAWQSTMPGCPVPVPLAWRAAHATRSASEQALVNSHRFQGGYVRADKCAGPRVEKQVGPDRTPGPTRVSLLASCAALAESERAW
jgi:hypothetical protein